MLNTPMSRQYAGETDIVANVSVTNITMLNAENGARIKVFGGNPDPSTYLHFKPARGATMLTESCQRARSAVALALSGTLPSETSTVWHPRIFDHPFCEISSCARIPPS